MATATTLRAFHGNPAIKERYQARLEQHHQRNQIIRHDYIRGGIKKGRFHKGAVGCTVHSDDHAAYESELGIPRVLARLLTFAL